MSPRSQRISKWTAGIHIALLLCGGCGWNATESPEKTAIPEKTANHSVEPQIEPKIATLSEIPQQQAVSVVDRIGRSTTFENVPQRIISLSPSTTELLFALGIGPSVVGATKNCNYPPQALQVPRVGNGTMEGISREMILAIKPDLVLCKWDTHAPLMELFDRVGIQSINLGPETLEELFGEARLLGRVFRREQESEAFIQQMSERLNRLVERVAKLEPSQRRTVFYEVWDEPLMTAGPKSFIGELLKMGQMRNLFDDADVRYPRISSEVVVDRNPDVILAPSNHMKQVEFSRLASRPGWANINAITKKQVFIINGDEVSRCGPRLLNALEQMIDAVYPETKIKETQLP